MVNIRTRGEVKWILRERDWYVDGPPPEGNQRADLSRANLIGANLSGTNLYNVNLSGADLRLQAWRL